MRLLLDTHAAAWALLKTGGLSAVARAAIESDDNTVLVSIASVWEIAIKVGIGKWPEARRLVEDFEGSIDSAGFELLPITIAHVRTAGLVQAARRDPFDRLLAEQAMIEGLPLVTADPKVRALGAPSLW